MCSNDFDSQLDREQVVATKAVTQTFSRASASALATARAVDCVFLEHVLKVVG